MQTEAAPEHFERWQSKRSRFENELCSARITARPHHRLNYHERQTTHNIPRAAIIIIHFSNDFSMYN